jgi:hypothetical protein
MNTTDRRVDLATVQPDILEHTVVKPLHAGGRGSAPEPLYESMEKSADRLGPHSLGALDHAAL